MGKWTFIFIAIIVLVFLYQTTFGTPPILTFIPAYALDMPWMFITSVFLHGGFSHLFFNTISLFFFGIYLERIIGSRAFFWLFISGGIVGNLGYLFTASDPYIPAIGASGAIYSVMGTLTVLRPSLLVFIYGMLPLPLILVTFFYVMLDFAGLFVPSGIAHGAHLAGLFLGVVVGLGIRLNMRRQLLAKYYYEEV